MLAMLAFGVTVGIASVPWWHDLILIGGAVFGDNILT